MNINFYDFIAISKDVNFYLHRNGFITCEQIFHSILFKTFLLRNWERFCRVVGHSFLLKTIESIKENDYLKFEINTLELFEPPTNIKFIISSEKRQTYVNKLLSQKNKNIFEFGILILCFCVCYKLFVGTKREQKK